MKISELSRRTGVPKETIHYYVREGFIPRPRKKGKNVSDYDESFVERILLIKQIQDHFFLPLSLIKKIVKQRNKFPEMKSLLELRIGYFSPLDQFIQKEVVGEDALARATGMAKKWIAEFEKWGVISSVAREGKRFILKMMSLLGNCWLIWIGRVSVLRTVLIPSLQGVTRTCSGRLSKWPMEAS